jgi:hypothetical protein
MYEMAIGPQEEVVGPNIAGEVVESKQTSAKPKRRNRKHRNKNKSALAEPRTMMSFENMGSQAELRCVQYVTIHRIQAYLRKYLEGVEVKHEVFPMSTIQIGVGGPEYMSCRVDFESLTCGKIKMYICDDVIPTREKVQLMFMIDGIRDIHIGGVPARDIKGIFELVDGFIHFDKKKNNLHELTEQLINKEFEDKEPT